MNTPSRLSLQTNHHALGTSDADWRTKLEIAEPDPVVGIRHAAIRGDETYRLHVASIPERVGCHFHAKGDEDYAVVAGAGTLHWGKVSGTADAYTVSWETPVDVNTGDSFIIPEGFAHQLAKRGDDNLVIVFGCPDSHLANDQDRTILPDAATLRKA